MAHKASNIYYLALWRNNLLIPEWWLNLYVSLAGPRNAQIKPYLGVCLWAWSWIGQHLIWWNQQSRLPSPVCVDFIQSTDSLQREQNRIKEQSKEIVPSCFLPARLLSPDISLLLALEWNSMCSVDLRSSDLDWNYTTSPPRSPAGKWQISGLLSLHNHVS